MNVRPLHPWDVSYAEARAIQERLVRRLLSRPAPRRIALWGGADISYARRRGPVTAAVVVLRGSDMTVVEESVVTGTAEFPYIPGLLTFREGPLLVEAFRRIRRRPDVVLLDGQGIAHPRGFGLAAHLGLLLDLPAIGCAKSRLVGEHGAVGPRRGSAARLVLDGRIVGAAVRSREGAKPIYVSPGHRIDVPGAVRCALRACRGYRVPEPVRQAHLLVNRVRAALEAGSRGGEAA